MKIDKKVSNNPGWFSALWIYTKYELIELIRSTRFFLYSALMSLVILLSNLIYYVITEKNLEVKDNPAVGENSLDYAYKRIIVMFTDEDRADFDYLMGIDPAVVFSAYSLIIFLPLLMVFLMFSSVAREVETRSTKMLVFFTGRITIYTAKFLSAAMVTFPFVAVAMAAGLVINANRLIPVIEQEQWLYVLKFIYYFFSFFLMSLSLALMASTFARSVYSAFGYSVLFLIFMGLLKYTKLSYFSPFMYTDLMFVQGNDVMIFLPITFLLFAAIFYLAGYLIFQKREFT